MLAVEWDTVRHHQYPLFPPNSKAKIKAVDSYNRSSSSQTDSLVPLPDWVAQVSLGLRLSPRDSPLRARSPRR